MAGNSEYTRLPGRGHSALGFGRSSLWLGDDHVLLLLRRGYSEDYKRFYFRDIRAIVLRKTPKFLIVNCVAGAMLAIFLLIHFLGFVEWNWEPIGHIFLGILTSTVFLVLLINLIQGTTCSTKLVTAVHTEPIPSMNRLRTSLRIMRLLRPKIEQVQGHLPREVLLQHPGVELPPVIQPPRISVATKEPTSNYKGGVHLALFAFMLLDAVHTVFSIFSRSKILLVLSLVANVVLWGLVIIALILQRRSSLPRSITGLTWGVLVYGIVFFTLSYFFYIFLTLQNQTFTASQWDQIKQLWNLSPLEHPGLLFLMVFSMACSLALGIPGFIGMLRIRMRARADKKMEIVGGETG